MTSLYDAIDNVKDKKTFLIFVELLLKDRLEADNKIMTLDGFQDGWANNDIAGFLESSLAWAKDSNFLKDTMNNPWQEFANFLLLGKLYE